MERSALPFHPCSCHIQPVAPVFVPVAEPQRPQLVGEKSWAVGSSALPGGGPAGSPHFLLGRGQPSPIAEGLQPPLGDGRLAGTLGQWRLRIPLGPGVS